MCEHLFPRDSTNSPCGHCAKCGLSFDAYEAQDPEHEAWIDAVIAEGEQVSA